MLGFGQAAKYPYLLSVIGVALAAISTVYGAVRGIMVRQTFRAGFNGPRQFGNMSGITSVVTIIAVIVAVAGLAWLGFVLRNSQKTGT